MSRVAPFDIRRTVRTYGLYFDEHADVLEDLLIQVDRCLSRLLPPQVADRIDAEGPTLWRDSDGRLHVRRHPSLEAARQALAEMGLFRVFLPEAMGGFGLPLAVYYLAVQLVSYHDTSLALVFLVHGNAMYALDRYGTQAQRDRYLPDLASGERVATVAFTEPLAGSDAGRIRTRADMQPDGGFILDGDKLFITDGGDADMLIATARTGPLALGIDGVSAFIVLREADRVELMGLEDKIGPRGSPTASLAFSGICLPSDRLLGALGQGGPVMFAGVGMTRVNIAAQALGIGKRAFEAAATFARERVQGGGPILGHEAVQGRLASMALTLSLMENLICLDSAIEAAGQWHVLEMSLCKYIASEALQDLTRRAMGVHGGYGLCRPYGVERCLREGLALPLYGGTSEIQRVIIARELRAALSGEARVDYRARGRDRIRRLRERCQGEQVQWGERCASGEERLWQAVERVSELDNPRVGDGPLTEMAAAVLSAQALLHQATGPEADALDQAMARLAVHRMELALDREEQALLHDEEAHLGRLLAVRLTAQSSD